jgi:uncharacterized membrane protein YhaH (DUF805 family)
MFESVGDLFRFSGRRNRKVFAACSVGLLVYFVLTALPFTIGLRSGSDVAMLVGGLVSLPLWLLGMVSSCALMAQRCRDFGWSGWATLICLVPYVGSAFAVAIVFVPGTDGPNRYGASPSAGPQGWPAE